MGEYMKVWIREGYKLSDGDRYEIEDFLMRWGNLRWGTAQLWLDTDFDVIGFNEIYYIIEDYIDGHNLSFREYLKITVGEDSSKIDYGELEELIDMNRFIKDVLRLFWKLKDNIEITGEYVENPNGWLEVGLDVRLRVGSKKFKYDEII